MQLLKLLVFSRTQFVLQNANLVTGEKRSVGVEPYHGTQQHLFVSTVQRAGSARRKGNLREVAVGMAPLFVEAVRVSGTFVAQSSKMVKLVCVVARRIVVTRQLVSFAVEENVLIQTVEKVAVMM